MKDFWDNRYQYEEYAYGTLPNEYLVQILPKYDPGTILFPAEGEGRNSVYAASLGWKAHAFDISSEGRRKALELAKSAETSIDYILSDLREDLFPHDHYDAIALIYSHFPSALRKEMYSWIRTSLKTNGIIIVEAFSPKNLEYQKMNPFIGGPSEPDMLFTLSELENTFADFTIRDAIECEVELHEGKYHNGVGSVIRFEAIKP